MVAQNILLESICNSPLQNTALILVYLQTALWSFSLFIATRLVLRKAAYKIILFSGNLWLLFEVGDAVRCRKHEPRWDGHTMI